MRGIDVVVIAILLLVILAIVIIATHRDTPRMAVVGDRFVHTNPGISNNPSESPNPFVLLSEVLESKGDMIRVRKIYIHWDGSSFMAEGWDRAYGYGEYGIKMEVANADR